VPNYCVTSHIESSFMIVLVTLYSLFFQLTSFIEMPSAVIFYMLTGMPLLIIVMVYVVLKYGKPSKYTFDEKFYEDVDYKEKANRSRIYKHTFDRSI
jgi:hypothetical protein